ncbi:hypothetical protein [Vibrio splendidus]|uniref:hypothetical protein n=1 Tax=Vibrio splendidus TaxID=29497 RepID=UPI000D34BDF4|nr:hypothetical protein [Vibrio splendidus]PTP75247.1 hypothetical protein CWO00_13285 [Vibrio splendidus]
MTDLYSNAIELMRSIKDRRKQIKYQPLSTDDNYQFEQTSADSFVINQRFLRLANSENGLMSCQGFYYNGGGYTYDPPQFHELRQALAKQGYISLNTSEQLSYDLVIATFSLNGLRLNVGDKFKSAVWHVNRVSS